MTVQIKSIGKTTQVQALGRGPRGDGNLVEEMVITNKLGLNLRTAAELVKVSSRFKSRISVEKDGNSADGKSLIGLISLAVVYGTRLRFSAQGGDGAEALEAIRELVQGKMEEN